MLHLNLKNQHLPSSEPPIYSDYLLCLFPVIPIPQKHAIASDTKFSLSVNWDHTVLIINHFHLMIVKNKITKEVFYLQEIIFFYPIYQPTSV